MDTVDPMFRAYVPAESATAIAAPVVDVHGRSVVCLAECATLEQLREEVADAWEAGGEILIVDPDGLIVTRG